MVISLTYVLCLLSLCHIFLSQTAWSYQINCIVSGWSEWKCCGSTCGRTRQVVSGPLNGGLACPKLTEVKHSNSRESPWDQSQVTQKVQSKFMSCGAGNVSCAQLADTPKVLLSRDLLFVIDVGWGINKTEFRRMKEKLADMIDLICGRIGKTIQHNRIAVISYSKFVNLNFDFQTYFSLSDVRRAIMKIRQSRSPSCTGNALYFAQTYMYDPVSGVRSATETVKDVIVITAGRSNCGRKLVEQAEKLRLKAFVFALVIGKASPQGKAEVEAMVSRPLIDHVFSLANFRRFFNMVDALKTFPGKCVPFELS